MKINYFNFKPWKNKWLITNEQGRYAIVPNEEFQNLIHGRYEQISEEFIEELKRKYFIIDENEDVFVERVKEPYREMKRYIFSATCLHIFVLTNQCNMCCVYCQAQDSAHTKKGKMTKEIAQKAVDIALQSPERRLDFEFQGGEPLVNFDIIRFIVEYADKYCNDKEIHYSVVTNTLLLNDEMIAYFKEHEISVSTSLDGNASVHNDNRPQINGEETFDIVKKNVKRLQDAQVSVGAIQTTTKKSLRYGKDIVDTYCNMGLHSLFLRPLTPLGYAREQWGEIGYTPEEFIEFYKRTLGYIIDKNKNGYYIQEGHACIFLAKILGGYAQNYMELRSPCGAAVGQMAYYYDGNIYTCDEGRMIAEMGDSTFCLGNVQEDDYDSLIDGRTCRVTCQASVLEGLPSCCDCVYHPYCGVCPVINLAMENNIYERHANNYRCKIYKGILDTLFEFLEKDKDVIGIFRSWIE